MGDDHIALTVGFELLFWTIAFGVYRTPRMSNPSFAVPPTLPHVRAPFGLVVRASFGVDLVNSARS